MRGTEVPPLAVINIIKDDLRDRYHSGLPEHTASRGWTMLIWGSANSRAARTIPRPDIAALSPALGSSPLASQTGEPRKCPTLNGPEANGLVGQRCGWLPDPPSPSRGRSNCLLGLQ